MDTNKKKINENLSEYRSSSTSKKGYISLLDCVEEERARLNPADHILRFRPSIPEMKGAPTREELLEQLQVTEAEFEEMMSKLRKQNDT